MRPGYRSPYRRRRRPWWRRWLALWWGVLRHPARPGNDVVLALAVMAVLGLVLVALYVLAP